MKILNCLNLKFSDPKMETEYTSIQKQSVMRDFQVTLGAVALTTFTVFLEKAIKQDVFGLIVPLCTVAIVLFIYGIRIFFAKQIEYLTLAVIFFYNAYRFVLISYDYHKSSKGSFFLNGYALTLYQTILVSRISNMPCKVLVVMFAYLVRFGMVGFVLEPGSLLNGTPVRQVILDAFMIYYFYSTEKTQRKVFQRFHESREELLKFKDLLANFLPQSVVVVDCNKCGFLFSNKAFSAIFENSGTKLASNNINLSLFRVDQATIRETGSSPYSTKTSLDYSDGPQQLDKVIKKLIIRNFLEDKILSLTASYVNNAEHKSFEVILKRITWDRTDAVAIIFNDITYQENIISLKIANTNKDKILATVSHELRTPLHGILGLLTLAEKKAKESRALEYISLIKDNARLLLVLVNSILDYQQITSGKLKLNMTKIDLSKILKDVIQLFQFQTKEKGIYINLIIEPDLPLQVLSDENRLKQIIINLIGNAIKFTAIGGVEVRVSQEIEDDRSLRISITDTGIGIRDEDKTKLFKMYGKLEDGESVNKNGVGLGLTISNALAIALNGTQEERGIEVSSQYGSGSTFFFRILKDLDVEIHFNKESSQERRDNCQAQTEGLEKQLLSIDQREEEENTENSLKSLGEDTLIPAHISLKLSRYINSKKANRSKLYSIPLKESVEYVIKQSSSEKSEDSRILKSSYRTNICSNNEILMVSIPRKERIIVVDDNPFNLLIARNLIEDFGYVVKSAISGQEAIELLKQAFQEKISIKAIFMDCQMPIMDGYEASKILVAMMERNEIEKAPILAWTANDSEKDIKRCFECGMVGHLTKPASHDTLLKVLSNLDEKLVTN